MLFVELSGFCSDFPVLDSNYIVFDHHKIQIIDNFWILQNVVPDFVDTDNYSFRIFPVAFILSLLLLEFIISNTFGIVQKNGWRIKLPSVDVDTVQ